MNLKSETLTAERLESTEIADSFWHIAVPLLSVLAASFSFAFLRIEFGAAYFPDDGGLMILALGCYLTAAVFYLTNFYVPLEIAAKLGSIGTILGVFLNLSSWLFRWTAGYERELEIFLIQGRNASDMPWFFRYIPFANLYDLSLAFAFGAGITTLAMMQRKQFRLVAAFSLPLAAIILILARFIGGEFIDLPPVLDSYWRPIHVGVASLSYGVSLVCFAAAVAYLLKEGLRSETIAIWTSVFAIAVFATISGFSIFALSSFGSYTASTFWGSSKISLALRADIPYVGWMVVFSAILLAGVLGANLISQYYRSKISSRIGRILLIASLIFQATGIGVLVYQINNLDNIPNRISPAQSERFALWLLREQKVSQTKISSLSSEFLQGVTTDWLSENGKMLRLSLQANPVELAALITAFTGTFFAVLLGFKTNRIRESLPSAKSLDGLMYKLGGIAFAGLALLLITGAVWANESWGRYWGWDSKETGAFVAWLTYAAFLHSRMTRGWTGKRSAYFAIIAFLFVIFTYLGVSYLLPGLHSYA